MLCPYTAHDRRAKFVQKSHSKYPLPVVNFATDSPANHRAILETTKQIAHLDYPDDLHDDQDDFPTKRSPKFF